jgi:hypothetical protein
VAAPTYRGLKLLGPLWLFATPALADPAPVVVLYKAPDAWVAAAPEVADSTFDTDKPIQFIYSDNQVREAADGTEQVFTAYRMKILKPEGLAAGNITTTWLPDEGPLTVHYVRLIRGGQVIDVLASTKFTIVQREQQLEQSILTGQRTATLQVPGVQVGDELAVAITTQRREPAFGGHAANFMQLPVLGTKGDYRFRLLWQGARPMNLRASRDLHLPPPIDVAGGHLVEIALHNPEGAIPTDGAPARYNLRRLVAWSDYANWADLSRQLAPLYDAAAADAGSATLQAAIDAIAARTADPTERAQAALQLVEDQIRYVYVGLNGGNLRPASADETWQHRFGDCKAKGVLLVAILRKLGIEAVPALVNSKGGDGIDQLLPGPAYFDHLIVRAVIAGKVVWLDGTRQGDRWLDNLPLLYRLALPLTVQGAELEKIAPHDNVFPEIIGVVDIDATAGVDQDARVNARNILRGDQAFAIRSQIAALSHDDADRALKAYWQQQLNWATADKVDWTYDDRRMALTLTLIARGNPGWTGDVRQGRTLTLPGAGFYPPDPMRRPLDQDQTAPWTVNFPHFKCWATTVHLPPAAHGFAWSLYADPMNRTLGGKIYWRASGFSGNIVRTVMSSHSIEPEANATEAAVVNRAIPGFNNNMSNVAEEPPGNVLKSSHVLPFADSVDWVNGPAPCSPGE